MGPEETTPQEQAWWKEMLDEPDPTRSLQIFIRGAGPAFARASTISDVRPAAARTDEEVREISDHHESLRREGFFGQVLDALATKGTLRPDLPRDRLLDIFLVVYGDATYHQFTTQMGWPHEDVMDWLCEQSTPSAPGVARKLISGVFQILGAIETTAQATIFLVHFQGRLDVRRACS